MNLLSILLCKIGLLPVRNIFEQISALEKTGWEGRSCKLSQELPASWASLL